MSALEFGLEDESKFFKAVKLFNEGEWYLAHDIFEEIWHITNGLERITIQAILQIAVAEVHLSNGNMSGAVILYGEGLGRIKNNELPNLGIDIDSFSLEVEKRFKILQNGGNIESSKSPKLKQIFT